MECIHPSLGLRRDGILRAEKICLPLGRGRDGAFFHGMAATTPKIQQDKHGAAFGHNQTTNIFSATQRNCSLEEACFIGLPPEIQLVQTNLFGRLDPIQR
jgi:hypothetical protein